MNNVVSIIGGVLVIIAAAAGVVGYFRANVSKSTIALYKQDNDALRARLKTVEDQVALDAIRIASLEQTRLALLAVVTQAEPIAKLHDLVTKIAVKVGVDDG